MSEELDALDDELLEAIAKVKGHSVQKAVPQPASAIYPMSAAEKTARLQAEKEAVAAWLKAEKEVWENPEPGQQMPDGTIYVGQYTPRNRTGVSLNQVFNVFAMAQDLPGTGTYLETVQRVAELKEQGYTGAGYADDMDLYDALRKGTYNGEWVIPPKEILHGKDVDGNDTTPQNLYGGRDKGAFRDTFDTTYDTNTSCGRKGLLYSFWYWSSTEVRCEARWVHTACFSATGDIGGQKDKDYRRLSCRPVRLVPCK